MRGSTYFTRAPWKATLTSYATNVGEPLLLQSRAHPALPLTTNYETPLECAGGWGPCHVVQALQHCHALLLECNHDAELLAQSSYPAFLKKRIAGPQGHLSNEDSAALTKALVHPSLNLIVAAHLSERNNRPDLAQSLVALAAGCQPADIQVADPLMGTPWFEVH